MYKTAQYDKLPHERILEKISDYDIFQRWFPFTEGKIYSSPLREDNTPSFSIFKGRNGRWNYKDLGNGDHGDAFRFVEQLLMQDYYTTCRIINQEFNLRLLEPIIGYNKVKTQNIAQQHSDEVKRAKIDVVIKPFTIKELNYWKKYGISREILDLYNVASCHKVFINNIIWRYSTEAIPIFAYFNPRTNNYKIYRPTAKYKTEKWRTNETNEWGIGGYDQLPKTGELLIFQKALKEVMTLYSMDYASCCTQGEGYSINPDFFRHLKKRFKRIILMYDNDVAGQMNSQRLAELHKLECIYTPEFKNISDYYEHKGKEASIKLMKELCKK